MMRMIGDRKFYTSPTYWDEKGIEKPATRIVCAATIVIVNEKEILLVGARHFDSQMRNQMANLGIRAGEWSKGESGFIDQFGYFHDRKEALKIVLENGQPFDPERNGSDDELFSEGLY